MDIHECPICCDVYNSKNRIPKITPCGHSLCFECLSKLTTNRCPECREPFPSNIKISKFITNFSLMPEKEKEETSLETVPTTCNPICTSLRNSTNSSELLCKLLFMDQEINSIVLMNQLITISEQFGDDLRKIKGLQFLNCKFDNECSMLFKWIGDYYAACIRIIEFLNTTFTKFEYTSLFNITNKVIIDNNYRPVDNTHWEFKYIFVQNQDNEIKKLSQVGKTSIEKNVYDSVLSNIESKLLKKSLSETRESPNNWPVSGTTIPRPHTSSSSNNRNDGLFYCTLCKTYQKINFTYRDGNRVPDLYCSDCRGDMWYN